MTWGVSPHSDPILGGSPHTLTPLLPHSGKISYYTRPPEMQGVQLEAQILTELGPALDLEALEKGDAEALAGEKWGIPPLPLCTLG